jgi:hypothetical protein
VHDAPALNFIDKEINMATPNINIPPLDPNGYSAQVRILGGPARTGEVTYDAGFTNSTTPAGVFDFSRWIYVGTSGNLAYTKWDGTTESLPNLAAGVWHPIYAKNILSIGTSIAADQLRWGS